MEGSGVMERMHVARRASAAIAAVAVLTVVTTSPAQAVGGGSRTGSDTACGTILGVLTVNCGSVSISAVSGSCTENNVGSLSEQLVCTAGSYSVSGTVSAWANPGSVTVTYDAGSPGGACHGTGSTGDSWGFMPRPTETFGPFTMTCPGFTVNYGFCANTGASITETFTGDFAPRTVQASATINQISDGCVPI
jgi:hypothetical protein